MSNRVAVEFSGRFRKNVRRLAKKYKRIRRDLEPLVERLENGETPGDRIAGLKGYRVYKTRIPNSDARRGKSGGYRVVYYLIANNTTVLLTIYTKSEQTDISANEIASIISDYCA